MRKEGTIVGKTKPFLFAIVLILITPAFSANISEYAVKAEYLYNFAKFVEWPPSVFVSSDAPIVLGVLGEDPFGTTLDDVIKGKVVEGRSLIVRRFSDPDTTPLDTLRSCQILFISDSEKDNMREPLSSVRGANLLTVSEIDQFPSLGGMITFDQEGDRIGLVVNPKSVKKAGLTLRAQLMQIAKIYNKVDASKVKALYFEGITLYINGQLRDAIRKWEECLQEDPDNTDVQGKIGQARAKLKNISNLR